MQCIRQFRRNQDLIRYWPIYFKDSAVSLSIFIMLLAAGFFSSFTCTPLLSSWMRSGPQFYPCSRHGKLWRPDHENSKLKSPAKKQKRFLDILSKVPSQVKWDADGSLFLQEVGPEPPGVLQETLSSMQR